MTIHLIKEVSRLKKMIMTLAGLVEDSTQRAVAALMNTDAALANEVIEQDQTIDALEMELEEECLKILALYQPVASDLRYVVACLKINNDLERIGDLACGIAKSARAVSKYDRALKLDLNGIMSKAQNMLKMCLEALIDLNPETALKVCALDDEVDQLRTELNNRLKEMMKNDPDHLEYYIRYVSAVRHIERIADYATNISEDVVYLCKGEIIRHGGMD